MARMDRTENLNGVDKEVHSVASDLLEMGSEKIKEIKTAVQDNVTVVEDLYGDVIKAVKKNPAQSLGVALLVGIGIGSLIFRESR